MNDSAGAARVLSLGRDRDSLPVTVRVAGQEIAFRLMTPGDEDEVLRFARRLPPRDLLFLRRDITNRTDVQQWGAEIAADTMTTVLATRPDGGIIGYATLDRGEVRWTRHVAEIRVLLDPAARGWGLGRMLLQIAFERALAAGAAKIVAQLTPDQQGTRGLFERLGFEQEAVLRNHVIDAYGRKHDLIVLSFDTERHRLRTCDLCGQEVVTLLPLERAHFCWGCYEIRYREFGAGG